MHCKIHGAIDRVKRVFHKDDGTCRLESRCQPPDSVLFYRARRLSAFRTYREQKWEERSQARSNKEERERRVVTWLVSSEGSGVDAGMERWELGKLKELFPKEAGEIEEVFETRIRLMAEISSQSWPEVDWTRYECVAWVYHSLVDTLQNSHDCAALKARKFVESGAWLLRMDRQDWEIVIGRNGGGASLFARVRDIEDERARLGESELPSYGSCIGGDEEEGDDIEDRREAMSLYWTDKSVDEYSCYDEDKEEETDEDDCWTKRVQYVPTGLPVLPPTRRRRGFTLRRRKGRE